MHILVTIGLIYLGGWLVIEICQQGFLPILLAIFFAPLVIGAFVWGVIFLNGTPWPGYAIFAMIAGGLAWEMGGFAWEIGSEIRAFFQRSSRKTISPK
jgi:hypothetical protein